MPVFGRASQERLATLHPDLQGVLIEAIEHRDFVIVCGHRNEADQNKALAEGKSKVAFPNSKHNSMPSLAVDIAPYTGRAIDWNDAKAFAALAGFVCGIAAARGVKLRWGGDWNSDGATSDERFVDLPHLEVAE